MRADLTGQRFGEWRVVDYFQKGRWNCICSCGTKQILSTTDLVKGKSTNCGCKRYEDLTGKRFGRWTVLGETVIKIKPDGHHRRYWVCRCDCGTVREVYQRALKNGKTVSCGCYKAEVASQRRKHGLHNSRIYKIWNGMKNRCYLSTLEVYKYYGGRGITICDEWKDDFQNFYDWAMANGYNDTLTIDRIDVNGNYEPDNCRWTTVKVQQNNKRNNRSLQLSGGKITMSELSNISAIPYSTLRNRIEHGMSVEEASTTPIDLTKIGGHSVVRIEGDILYKSLTEAAQANNSHVSAISRVCKGLSKTAGGYHWKLANV